MDLYGPLYRSNTFLFEQNSSIQISFDDILLWFTGILTSVARSLRHHSYLGNHFIIPKDKERGGDVLNKPKNSA